MKNKQGFSILVLIIILAVLAGGGYWVWQKRENNKTPPPVIYTDEQVDEVNLGNLGDIIEPGPVMVDEDTAKSTFDQIKLGVQQKRPLSSLSQYFTVSSQQMINTPGFNLSCVDMVYVSEAKEADKIIVQGDCIDQDGNRRSGAYVFSSDGGVWKLDFPATLERLSKQSFSKPPNQNTQTGSVDLAILDIQVTPNQPKAGDKNVKIEARIKNIGTKAFTGGVNIKALIGTNSSNQQTGFYTGTVDPGEIFRYTISYSGYLLLSNDSSPGAKNVHFEIDYDNKIVESNKTNNKINQIVTFIP
ncbi:MAG: hypothetical protein HYT46_02090 [Candidatus Vogelbacteria bacterium]|nr:hypothetical protein [Candidatus Vogelbacteria bacterium]